MADTTLVARRRDRARKHDIVLFGASGFTGKLVAEYLIRTYAKTDLRLALAGRDRAKLEVVRRELGAIDAAATDLPILIGDSHDRQALEAIATDAGVVCTTVGPYAKYGAELVAACVAKGTDYCDLTGETQFVRRTIDAHHAEAGRTGARIVHCCGFDSIPSDIGTWMMQEAMKTRHGGRLHQVRFFCGESSGGFSGGTVASLLNIVEEAKANRDTGRILADPYALNPEGERQGPDGPDQRGVRYDSALGMWTGPFIMAAINTRVVRRTNALLDYAYGRDFQYSEAMSFGKGPKGLMIAASVTSALAGFMGAMAVKPTRELLKHKVLPKPGEGPTKEKRENGHFTVRLIGTGRDSAGQPVTLRGLVKGEQDPGYGETSKMLGEAAVCLAVDGPKLDAPGGIGTPASTMGARMLERLRAARMTFAVD